MKIKIFFLFILVFQQSISQSQLRGIVVDKETNEPIEYADIYNGNDFTYSNEEGKFLFNSTNDSLKVGILGYYTLFSTFQEQNSDTIFLTPKIQDLKEVVINADGTLLSSILENLEKNYPLEPFKEKFFLRSVLKKNDKIVMLVDFSGKVQRQTLFSTKSSPMPKKNYSVEIENLRKAGIKEDDIDFSLSSFEELFNNFISIYMSPKVYDLKYIPYQDSSFAKLEFYPKKDEGFYSTGYYLVNLDDKAFNEVHITNSLVSQYTVRKNIKYRTTDYNLEVTFKKNRINDKYSIDKANLTATVEVINKKGERDLYNVNYKFITYDNFENFEVNNNISLSKNIFDLKADYDDEFWNSQNYLLLTQELESFLESINEENKDFTSVSNIKS